MYVLDTNIIISDPQAIFAFQEHDVVIPIRVLEELDGLKNSTRPHVAAQARIANRLLNQHQIGHEFIELKSGGRIKIEMGFNKGFVVQTLDHFNLDTDRSDNKILAITYGLQQNLDRRQYKDVILVCLDNNMSSKARTMGIRVEPYKTIAVKTHKDEFQLKSLALSYKELKELGGYDFNKKELITNKRISEFVKTQGVIENEGIILRLDDPNKTPQLTCVWKQGRMKKVNTDNASVYNNGIIKPCIPDHYHGEFTFNPGLEVFIENLFDPNVSVLSCLGQAGTGKTKTAIFAAIKLIQDGKYSSLIISRPIVGTGRESLGFLPGSKEDKMAPWLAPMQHFLSEGLAGELKKLKPQTNLKEEKMARGREILDGMMKTGVIEVVATEHIRGRNFDDVIVIVDEAQNMTQEEIKAWGTRIGKNVKFIIIGDHKQIDSSLLNEDDNALISLFHRSKGAEFAASIPLSIGVRSKEANWFANNM